MAQDIVSDALNQIMNAKRAGKDKVEIKWVSKLLLNLLEMMKENGNITFELDEDNKKVEITLLKVNECRAIKPRYYVGVKDIEKYLRRFLPSRNFGTLVISTNKGLMNQKQVEENKIGGSLIAYFY